MYYFDEPDDDYSSLDALARRTSRKMRFTHKDDNSIKIVYEVNIRRPEYERKLGWPEYDKMLIQTIMSLKGEALASFVRPAGDYANMTWTRIADTMADQGDSYLNMMNKSIFNYAKMRGCLNYVGTVIEANPKKCTFVQSN